MDTLYIVIPAYNEEENIERVINDWYPIIEKYNGEGKSRLIIMNDGSKDKTFEIMEKLAIDKPLFLPITKENSGHGSTVLYGYNYAIKNKADFVFQTDSDGQTLPDEFHDFWKKRNESDMVIGYRATREDGLSRVFVTKILKLVIKICFHVNVTDANTPFRLMKRKSLEENITLIPKDFNLSNVLLSVIYEKKNMKVEYIPITFRPRQGGVNSINLKKIFKIGLQAFKDFKEINTIIK
ncbi:MAG: glycosyltransferase family 2 protein [Erysipelotrichaceae bacterium]